MSTTVLTNTIQQLHRILELCQDFPAWEVSEKIEKQIATLEEILEQKKHENKTCTK